MFEKLPECENCHHPIAWHMLGWPEDMPGADICYGENCFCFNALEELEPEETTMPDLDFELNPEVSCVGCGNDCGTANTCTRCSYCKKPMHTEADCWYEHKLDCEVYMGDGHGQPPAYDFQIR